MGISTETRKKYPVGDPKNPKPSGLYKGGSRNRGVRHSSILYAFLIDGRWHTVSEFWPHLVRNIDPTVAMRSYRMGTHRGRRGLDPQTDMTLEQQVASGVRRLVSNVLRVNVKRGVVEVVETERADRSATDCVQQWQVRMTPIGNAWVRRTPGLAWGAMRSLWERGELELAEVNAMAPLLESGPAEPPEPSEVAE
jgi:hypothetical protein